MDVVYLTKEGLKKLQEEVRILKEETIPQIASRIDEARQMGDLSENAEYHAAREEMAWAQTRLAEREATMRLSTLIEEKTKRAHEVDVGATVVVEWDGHEKTFTIVGPTEVDPKQGKISNESPLGRAFLGKRPGDTVTVEVPDGTRLYTIKRIA